MEWLRWGFESRNRWEYVEDAEDFQQTPESIESYFRTRNRIWGEARPITNMALFARLMTEPRYYVRPESKKGWSTQEGLFDELFIQGENIFDQPISLKAGRQEIQFGDRWLIFDGTPGDGSRSEFFDAARLTIELDDRRTRLDLIGLKINAEADAWLPVINDLERPLAEQDESAAIVYLQHQFRPSIKLETHYIYRNLERESANGDDGNIHMPGLRASGSLVTNLEYYAETAVEFGEKNGRDLAAWGFNSQLMAKLGGTWAHDIHVGYEQLSGDDPSTSQDEGWDPVWGRRGRWSELMVYAFGTEADGRRGYFTNLKRPYIGWGSRPHKKLELLAEYMALFANTNPNAADPVFSEDGRFRGHLMLLLARYNLTKHISGHFRSETFFPGDYYAPDHRDRAQFFRAEMTFSF